MKIIRTAEINEYFIAEVDTGIGSPEIYIYENIDYKIFKSMFEFAERNIRQLPTPMDWKLGCFKETLSEYIEKVIQAL